MSENEIENVLSTLTKYKKCRDMVNTFPVECNNRRCDDCPYYYTNDMLEAAINQVIILLQKSKEKENQNQLLFSNIDDFIREIYRIDGIIQADWSRIQSYLRLLEKNSIITCSFDPDYNDYVMPLDQKDIGDLLNNANEKLNKDIDHLQAVMEGDPR